MKQQENLFPGFDPQMIDFLWELKMNNHKEWMEQNRERYRTVLKEPFDALALRLSQGVRQWGEDMPTEFGISRINRDIRFSKDKSPYRPRRWVVLKESTVEGTSWKTMPVFYFEITSTEYDIGMGLYDASPAFMRAFRAKIDANVQEFLRIAEALEKEKNIRVDGEDYRRPFPADHPPLVQRWYRKKTMGITESHPIDALLFGDKLEGYILKQWKKMLPLYRFCRSCVY